MSDVWTLQSLIDGLAERGAAPALITVKGETVQIVSRAELAEAVRRLASGLLGLGIADGETVALISPNGPEWVTARFALGEIGAVAVALDHLATEAELRTTLVDAGCSRVLTSAEHVATLRRIDAAFQLIVLDDAAPPGTLGWKNLPAGLPSQSRQVRPDAPAMLVYTSGTTGAPKGFFLTYVNLWANLRTLVEERLVHPGDRVLLPLPLHHVYPFLVGLLTPLCSGAAVVFSEASGQQIVQALRVADVSAIIGVPRLYAALLSGLEARLATVGILGKTMFHMALGACAWLMRQHGMNAGRWFFRRTRARIGPKLRMLASGGARLEDDVLWPLLGLGFEIRSGYGLAETASIFTGNLPGRERLGSEGRPFRGGELRISAADDQGVGEIQLRGPNVFPGYRNNPEANAEAFTQDGWFRTGDLGRLDADGFLYVTGRSKETIVLGGGKKVHPEELEKLYGTIKHIREIAVLERKGGLVALVAPDFESIRGSSSVRIDDMIRVALATRAGTLPSYERLAGFAIVREPLPRTRLGKYRRFRLPELYEHAIAGSGHPLSETFTPEDEALLAQGRAREIFEFLKARYPTKEVKLDANPLLDLGIDSLEWVALGLALEERLDLRLDESSAAEVMSVRDLLQLVVQSEMAGKPPAKTLPGLTATELHWLEPSGLGLTIVGILIYGLNRLLMRSLFPLRVTGLENLAACGQCVFVSNHASDLDPLLLAASLGLRRMRRVYWGGEVTRLFVHRWLHPLLKALHVFPVDERAPAKTIALAVEALHRGYDLIWFPEAWRSPDGNLQRFLPGIGILLETGRIPAVPIYIGGSFEAMPRDRNLPHLRLIRVSIGRPFDPANLVETEPSEIRHRQIAELLLESVAALRADAHRTARV